MNTILAKLRALFRRRTLEAEMVEEMRQHLELRTREKIAEGMPPDEARYAAQREFGGIAQVQEQCRDERLRGLVWLEHLGQDLHYAMRSLRRSPAFTVTVVLTLALGIGANTAIFSVVNAALLRGLPYREPERLMRVLATVGGNAGGSTTAPDFVEWQEGARSFEAMAGLIFRSHNLAGSGEPARVSGARVSANYFDVLGVAPILGRTFTAEEDLSAGNRVVMIGHGLWQQRFAGDPNALGQTLLLDGEPHTIVGVLPAAIELFAANVQAWTPLALTAQEIASTGNRRVSVTARLRAGVTREQAQAELQTIAQAIAEKRAHSNKGWSVALRPIRDQLLGEIRQPLYTLFGAVGFVLLIACANVGNLLLARGEARQREIAVRATLGAGRLRIVRQLLTENLLLAALGGAAGLGLAKLGVDALVWLLPQSVPRLHEVSLDGTVLAFTAGTVLLTGVLFGLLPSLRATRIPLSAALQRSGRTSAGGGKLRSGLVVTEIALALVLLVGAGLLARSFGRLLAVDTGLRAESALAFQTALPEGRYPRPAQAAMLGEAVLERLRALPDVQSAALVSHVPFGSGSLSISVTILGRPPVEPQKLPNAQYRAASPGYFQTLGIPVVAGRVLDERDRANAPRVAVVNQTMAHRLWPNENPLGARFTVDDNEKEPIEVVGVVGDVRHFGPAADVPPEFFVPLAQAPEAFWRFVGRVLFVVAQPRGEPATVLAVMRRAVWAVDADLPLYRVMTLQQMRDERTAMPRAYGALLGAFALAALALAALGIYGVIAYRVAQRTREMGVRIALGASARDVLRLIVGEGARLALLGVGLGLAGALALTRLIASQLYQVSATDPEVFAGVAALLGAIAIVACWIPARRAARSDPMVALRCE